jgi:carbon-monoxide dehydrogenase medium subunit
MKAGSFEWHPARSADEAVALLAEYAPQDGRVIAGGQSLVPSMALRLAFPSHLIDINGVEEFSRVRVEGGDLVIGACVRHAAFHAPVEPGPLGRLLAQVVHNIAHYPIRQRGTFCGSLANADRPIGRSPLPLRRGGPAGCHGRAGTPRATTGSPRGGQSASP